MAEVILFDVNGTLLDMRALDPHFARVFGDPLARERWFKELQGLWMTTIATGSYRGFDVLAQAALQVLAEREGAELSAEDRAAVMEQMDELPPFGDAAGALQRLRDGGLRLAALTNCTLKSATAQLAHAGLDEFFEAVMSADQVERYKPAPEPYHMAAERLEVKPRQLRLVAAHAWDIAGAHAAGLETAFVARPRKVLNPAGPIPTCAETISWSSRSGFSRKMPDRMEGRLPRWTSTWKTCRAFWTTARRASWSRRSRTDWSTRGTSRWSAERGDRPWHRVRERFWGMFEGPYRGREPLAQMRTVADHCNGRAAAGGTGPAARPAHVFSAWDDAVDHP